MIGQMARVERGQWGKLVHCFNLLMNKRLGSWQIKAKFTFTPQTIYCWVLAALPATSMMSIKERNFTKNLKDIDRERLQKQVKGKIYLYVYCLFLKREKFLFLLIQTNSAKFGGTFSHLSICRFNFYFKNYNWTIFVSSVSFCILGIALAVLMCICNSVTLCKQVPHHL